MRTPLIAGNWKMHKTLAEARVLVEGIRVAVAGVRGVEVLICPPFHLLFPMAKAVAGSSIMLGAQNAHEADFGAFTGEVSVPMLKDAGCTHVIIGHSERRQFFGEDGALLASKARAVLRGGLNLIYCVGETLPQRDDGTTQAVVERQLAEVVDHQLDPAKLIVAYEPVWAIGTGRTATPAQAQEVHGLIRRRLASIYGRPADSVRILYGGSVKPRNAADLLAQSDIDGALVGGASLDAGEFTTIITAAALAASDASRGGPSL